MVPMCENVTTKPIVLDNEYTLVEKMDNQTPWYESVIPPLTGQRQENP